MTGGGGAGIATGATTGAMIGAALALCVTAAATLSIGVGLQRLIDRGLSAGNPAMLDRALLLSAFGVPLYVSGMMVSAFGLRQLQALGGA